jgi:hypothetical protein
MVATSDNSHQSSEFTETKAIMRSQTGSVPFGDNYERLSEIKTKFDLTTLFWVTPGVHADKMRAVENRVCQMGEAIQSTLRTSVAPILDLQKMAKAQVMLERFGGAEMKLNFPEPGKMEGFNN